MAFIFINKKIKMRVVNLVTADLYNIIPENVEEEKFINLKKKIKKDILESIPYSPKEVLESQWFWNKLSHLINMTISEEDYNNIPWCKQFIDIFQDPNYKKDCPEYHY